MLAAYPLGEEKKDFSALPVAPALSPPPPQPLAAPTRIPDLKEPEPEEAVEYNAAKEARKAMIGTLCVGACVFGGLAVLLVGGSSFQQPVCRDDDWYKKNDREAPKNCDICGSGTIVIPLGGEWELSWNKPMRAVLYFLGLGWCFLGIAIVCDQFMAAIEEITSKERVVWMRVHGDTLHKFHKRIWNDTVANLSLMALGSSAPEILLSVIELVGNSFFAGELGPSTIVGSAAFNLLVITAVCVMAIPAPETRKIDGLAVFAVTASLSVFAYAWLIVILQLNSPDVVSTTEACLTFAFFPMLIIIAFLADKGYLSGGCGQQKKARKAECAITEEQARLERLYSKKISFETVKMIVDANSNQKPTLTKAQHRKTAMRMISGGKKELDVPAVTVGFKDTKYFCLECCGTFDVPLILSQRLDGRLEVRYYTQDGLALSGKRYERTEGTVVFEPGETEMNISIPIIDNEVWEEQEDFSICLENLTKWGGNTSNAGYGNKQTTVVILNDDEPGTLGFYVDEVKASVDAVSVQLGVSRTNGSTGRISCHYTTVDGSAVAGANYTASEGDLIFEEGVSKASITIAIKQLPKGQRSDRSFRCMLHKPSLGVKFDAETEGGTESAICDIIIPGAASKRGMIMSLLRCCACNLRFNESLPEWKNQFVTAVYCNGDAAGQSTSTKQDWVFHCLSLPWKLLFATVPPAAIAGGWACFCCALGMIGSVTMVVGDMAALMGCCLGIPDDITAITIVALGTSLPDTFASKSAAVHDPNADNSIGNVTGSNCVNVFLGLGLPWTVGAFFWQSQKKTDAWLKKDYKGLNYEEEWGTVCPEGCFLVPAGNLSFSVTVFTVTALSCIALLVYRRKAYGGELGGPAFAAKRDACILVALWFTYIVLSILKSKEVL
jgi:solute carrier family 8 (sodium/calcium exchanger)